MILQTIRDRLRERGLTAAEASQRAVGNPYLISNLGRERYGLPSLENLSALADVLGLELYFGPAREQPSGHEAIEMMEYAKVPLHDVELAAGFGRNNGAEAVVDEVVFRRDWLKKMGVSPQNARLARVRGDSMEPVLKDGDMVLIDTKRTTIPARPRKPGKPPRADLYAVLDGDEARVKRVEHSQVGRLILHSDNHVLYPPEIREGGSAKDLGIIGKVVWWGHTVKE